MVMQEEFELEASLGYIVSSRQPLWAVFFLKIKKFNSQRCLNVIGQILTMFHIIC